MKSLNILEKALLSEKGYAQMEKGIYTFLVNIKATKKQISKQIESHFGVKVKKVNVLSIKPKTKRIPRTRGYFQTQGGKKAIVYLEKGQSIPMLSPKTESKQKNKKKEK